MLKRNIPNFISLLNLLSGLIALIFVFQQQWLWASAFVLLGIFFDFFDGLAARSFNASSKMGLELDSLADMVTSGVVPGFTLFFMLQDALDISLTQDFSFKSIVPFAGLLVTLGSAFRLAKFNVDDRQTSSFIGLPTPANTLFIMSLALIAYEQTEYNLKNTILQVYFLVSIAILSAYLLNAELALFSLKFKSFDWNRNKEKYILIILSVVLIPLLKFIAIPLIIICYIILSILFKKQEN